MFLVISALLFSCSDNESQKKDKVSNQFFLTELLERDKDLSYDEFIKINQKYDGLKTQYNKNNNDYATLLKLAEIYIYEARVSGEHPYYYQAALQTLAEILKQEVNLSKDQHFTALFYKATVQLSQHNFNEALVTANTALALNDKNAGIYGVLVDANVEIGNYDEAVKMCDKMMQIRPDLRSYSRTSYLRELHGDLDGSKKAMIMAINAGAPYSEYKCWSIITLGNIFEAEGQLDSAKICYDMALEERANYPFGIAGKARIEAKKENYAEANLLYNEAINILPEIGFNISLAKLRKKEGKQEEVTKMVRDIETMFKEDIESGHNMNLEYASFLMNFKSDYKTALELGLKEYQLRPHNIDVNKLLAFTYYGLKDTENAKKHLAIARATNKPDADLICLEGLIDNNTIEIKTALALNPYQDHLFVNEAKSFMN